MSYKKFIFALLIYFSSFLNVQSIEPDLFLLHLEFCTSGKKKENVFIRKELYAKVKT